LMVPAMELQVTQQLLLQGGSSKDLSERQSLRTALHDVVLSVRGQGSLPSVLGRWSAAGPRMEVIESATPRQRGIHSSFEVLAIDGADESPLAEERSQASSTQPRVSRMPTVDEFLTDATPEPGDSASSLLVLERQEPSAPSTSLDDTQDVCALEGATGASSDSWDASDDEESLALSACSCDHSDEEVAHGVESTNHRVRAMLKHLQDGQASLADVQGKLQEMQLRVVSYVENKFEQHLSEWKGELAEEVAWQLSNALGAAGGCGPVSDEAALCSSGTNSRHQLVLVQEQLSREIEDLKADLAKHARHVAIIEERIEAIPTASPTALAACHQDAGTPKSAVSDACEGKLTCLEEVVGTLLKTGGSDCHLQPPTSEEDETSDSCGSSSSSDSMPLCEHSKLARPPCSLRAAARHGIPCLRLLPAAEQWPALKGQPSRGDDSATGASDLDRGAIDPKGPACTWYVLSPRVRDAPLAPRGSAPNRAQLLLSSAVPRAERSQ